MVVVAEAMAVVQEENAGSYTPPPPPPPEKAVRMLRCGAELGGYPGQTDWAILECRTDKTFWWLGVGRRKAQG